MSFYIGQKVVCVREGPTEDRSEESRKHETYPVLNIVYTIRESKLLSDQWGYHLVEIVNPIRKYKSRSNPNGPTFMGELWFRHDRFKPLLKTNISVFESMLNPTPEDIEKFKKELEVL